jgi:trigger factor
MTIEKSDYEQHVKKALNDCRRRAEVKGFRPGMAPMSLIEKNYGKTVLIDELSKLMTDGLNKYITDSQLHLLGEPIPVNMEEAIENRKNKDTFEFLFEIGLEPKLTFTLSKDDVIPYYTIIITEEEKEKETQVILKEGGTLVEQETADKTALLTVDLVQNERTIENALIALQRIEDSPLKEPFIGRKIGDELTVNVKQLFTNENDLAAMLKIRKEELSQIEPEFTVQIKKIERFVEAELNQSFFDRLFGAGVVTDKEVFMQQVEDRLQGKYHQDSEYRLAIDIYQALEKKASMTLPDAFLKRWLQYSDNNKITSENVEKMYPWFAAGCRRQIINKYIMRSQNMKITKDELLEKAKRVVQYQFFMYGIYNATEEDFAYYAKSLLAKEKESKQIYDQVEKEKVIDYVRATVTIDERRITSEALQELIKRDEPQDSELAE